MFFLAKENIFKNVKWFENDSFKGNFLCTHLHYGTMQHLFGS
jgi:hypothetical protein